MTSLLPPSIYPAIKPAADLINEREDSIAQYFRHEALAYAFTLLIEPGIPNNKRVSHALKWLEVQLQSSGAGLPGGYPGTAALREAVNSLHGQAQKLSRDLHTAHDV